MYVAYRGGTNHWLALPMLVKLAVMAFLVDGQKCSSSVGPDIRLQTGHVSKSSIRFFSNTMYFESLYPVEDVSLFKTNGILDIHNVSLTSRYVN